MGLPVILKNEVPQAHGLDKLMPFGRFFFAIPLAVFAGEHFTIGKFMAPMVPSWIPVHVFWIYLVGVALVGAALSIVFKKYSQLAATLLGIMILLFVVLLHVPGSSPTRSDRISWAVALRDLAFSGGAFAFAGAQRKLNVPQNTSSLLVTLARLLYRRHSALLSASNIFFIPSSPPASRSQKLTPTWIPLRLFWAYLAGAVLLATGTCLLLNKKARLAATYLGLIILS